jgi:GTP cyclohydrolase I
MTTCESCGNDDAVLCLECVDGDTGDVVEGDTVASLVDRATDGVVALLRLMGEDPQRPGLAETPARVVRAYLEMASRPGDPGADLAVVFPDVAHPGTPVTVGPIPFVSLCEHHLLPFTGEAWVAYVPTGGRVVGLSKLPRTVAHYAGRPQVQERLTGQIADALVEHLDPAGVGVLIRGNHTCMSLRGSRTSGALMDTVDLRGILSRDPGRQFFLDTTRRAPAGVA